MSASILGWTPADGADVIDFIVGIQRGEFGLEITAADQPDLADVPGFYLTPGGRFWVARDPCAGGAVVGTIAAVVVEPNTIALRKMFVHRSQRGTGLAAALMDTLTTWARRSGYRTILLGTTDAMKAAHRFYDKHGFRPIDPSQLPSEFPRMAVDTLFFRAEVAGAVHVREYDPSWPAVFQRLRDELIAALPGLPVQIEHTGSTSVPGLAAKPIIDITIGVPDSTDEAAYFPGLERAGYTFVLREPEWFEHRLFTHDWPRANLHVFSTGCEEVDRMICFRDHLRTDRADRELYERVKRDLASRDWGIVQDYADAKTAVVSEIMTRAARREDG